MEDGRFIVGIASTMCHETNQSIYIYSFDKNSEESTRKITLNYCTHVDETLHHLISEKRRRLCLTSQSRPVWWRKRKMILKQFQKPGEKEFLKAKFVFQVGTSANEWRHWSWFPRPHPIDFGLDWKECEWHLCSSSSNENRFFSFTSIFTFVT